MDSENILDLIRDFVQLQESIMNIFQAQYEQVKDWKYMIGCPKNGVLKALGGKWNFYKHGSGVHFENEANSVVIDIIKWNIELPKAFDISRITSYFVSKNIVEIIFQGEQYDLSDESDVNKIIEIFIAEQLICSVDSYPKTYMIKAEQAFMP
jgi:hypothetical protein